MPQTIRVYYQALHGRTTANFNWPEINHDSVVLITASEYTVNEDDPANSTRFVGSANITVENIAPHGPPTDPNHGVTFVIVVDWKSPLLVAVDITLLDDPPVITQVA